MSHFYGDLQGSRGKVTRCGTKNSGIDSHTRGWDVGIEVIGIHQGGKDVFYIYATKGSNSNERVGIAVVDEDGIVLKTEQKS